MTESAADRGARLRGAYWNLYTTYADSSYEPPPSCSTSEELLILCNKAQNAVAGCFVEVGVWRGGSAYYLQNIARRQGREFWMYDTFEGMKDYTPEKGDTIKLGDIRTDEGLTRIALQLPTHLYKCTFPHTEHLPPAPIAFAHIDCDQYKSIIETCRALEPRMAHKGVMWFDDTPVLAGARTAVRELYTDRIKQDDGSDRWYVEF